MMDKEYSSGLATGSFLGLFLPRSSRNYRKQHAWQQEIAREQEHLVRLALAESIPEKNVKMAKETTNDAPEKQASGAIKYDAGKPSVFQGVIQYFPRALWGVAEISTFGAKKYAWKGWQGVEDGYNRYQDAKYRHALKQAMGEEIDDDSELMHLKHEAWGALAALELYLREQEKTVGTN